MSLSSRSRECERWSRESAYGQHLLMRTLAREASRSQQHMLGLGTMRAERRMAIFLLDLSQRYQHLGWSRSQFLLSMLRQDIGSYLGLTLETVSRLLSRMQRDGVLQVQGKSISLLDFPALWRLAGTTPEHQYPALDPIVDREGNLAARALVGTLSLVKRASCWSKYTGAGPKLPMPR